MGALENGGRGSVISGGSCQNRRQTIDSPGGPRFHPNRGLGYHIYGAIYTHPDGAGVDQIRTILSLE